MNNGGIKETAVCLKERTEVHQMQQSVTLYQWMNKIQELAQKTQQHAETKWNRLTKNHDKMLMTKRRNNKQIKSSTTPKKEKNCNEMQS